jgi:hypothetical protein
MKQENSLQFEEVGRSASKASHAGIIRIGFEGISQPHFVEHPCFNILIQTLPGRFCNPWKPGIDSHSLCSADAQV